jgi:hypothetical protein
MSGNRYWLVPVSGFDDQVILAATAAKAKWATLKSAKEAGYFKGSEGSARYFASLGCIREIDEREARSRIGGHRPIGAGPEWGQS